MSDEIEIVNVSQEEIDAFNTANMISINSKGYDIEIIDLEKIEIKPQPWLWNKIIPLDSTTLFAGYGNNGKSQLLLFLAAHVSNGEPFKVAQEEHQLPQGSVIILSGEDDINYQLKPRLIAANADLSKIQILKMMKHPDKPKALLDLDKNLHLLEQVIVDKKNQGQEVKLIIIDPVQYFIGEMKDHINTIVGRFILSLNDLAKKHHLAIIMNKHLRKKGGGESFSGATDSVAGSGGWTTSPRSCWLIQRHPQKQDVIVFADMKGNLKAQDTQSRAFRIDKHFIENNGQKIETTKMVWLDKLEDLNADEALNIKKIPAIENSIRTWIINFLLERNKIPGNGAIYRSSELYTEALASGYKKTPFYEVRKKMLDEGLLTEFVDGIKQKAIMIKLNDPEIYS